MIRAVRAIRGSAWIVERDYDPTAFANALRAFQDRLWSLRVEAVNLEEDLQRRYNLLSVAPKLYMAPRIDVIDHQATRYDYNFDLNSAILDLL